MKTKAVRAVRQLNLPLSVSAQVFSLGSFPCYVCSRRISVRPFSTIFTTCRRCNAVHTLEWTGTERLNQYRAVIEVPGEILPEYLDKLNIPGIEEEEEEKEVEGEVESETTDSSPDPESEPEPV